MKSTAFVCAFACASLGLGTLAFAQGDGQRDERVQPQRIQQHGPRHAQPPAPQHYEGRPETRYDQRPQTWYEPRYEPRYEPHYDPRDARRNDRPGYYYNARGPEFRRGGYIPREFRNRQYVVMDYRPYHLAPPPRGHQWVQVGADYVLIAIATGLIANIVLSR